jgi:hypothetical protein
MILQKFTMNLFRVLRPFAEVHTRVTVDPPSRSC